MSTSACLRSLFLAKWIHFTSFYVISSWSVFNILLPFAHVFSSLFPTQMLIIFLGFPVDDTWPSHPIFLIRSPEYYSSIHKKGHKLWCSSLCSILESALSSSILSPIIFLTILFSNTLQLCSSLNSRYKVLHTHTKQTGEHILIFTLLDSRRDDEGFWNEWTPGSITKHNLKALLLVLVELVLSPQHSFSQAANFEEKKLKLSTSRYTKSWFVAEPRYT
jgi:hypothetical protein